MSPLKLIEYGLRVGEAKGGGQGLETELSIDIRLLLGVSEAGPVELSVFCPFSLKWNRDAWERGTCHALRWLAVQFPAVLIWENRTVVRTSAVLSERLLMEGNAILNE